MTEDQSINVKEDTLRNLKKIKKEMGFERKSWDTWFQEIFEQYLEENLTKNTLEEIFEQSTYEQYYDDWVKNFALNLDNIWAGNSARDLIPQDTNTDKLSSAIIIGRGPSVKKHNHLELLANSDYKGTIISTDGALPNVLKAGITPEKFKKFFVVTIDTNLSIRDFYKDPLVTQHGKEMKCILSTTVPKTTYDVIKNTGMKIYWIHTLFDYDKGKNSFNYISGIMTKSKNHKKGLPAIQTGGNVGTSSWMISWAILKHTHVGLIGIDHGYYLDDERGKNDHVLPTNVDRTSTAFKKAYPVIYNPEFDCYCQQDPIFQYYSTPLKEFIRRTSKLVKTINATEGGAIFGEGIECTKLTNFLTKYNF